MCPLQYLGVTLDSELNMNAYAKIVKKNVSYKAYLLSKLRTFVPTVHLFMIYKVYTLPLFDYGDILYAYANVNILAQLQMIQNRCLKYCLNLPRLTPTDYIHQELNIASLRNRRIYHQRLYGFKRSRCQNFLDRRVRVTRAAQGPVLFFSLVHSASYDESVEVTVGRAWNSLHHTIRNIEDLQMFKNRMKILMSNTIPTNQPVPVPMRF